MKKEKKLNNCVVNFPLDGLVRANQILGDKSNGTPPFFPVSRSQWFLGIKQGIYPKGIKLSDRVTVWEAKTIRDLVKKIAKGEAA